MAEFHTITGALFGMTVIFLASLIAQLVKNLMQETLVQFVGWQDPTNRIGYPLQYSWASLVAQLVKNPPAMRETWVGKMP